jgi:hypothetical protein
MIRVARSHAGLHQEAGPTPHALQSSDFRLQTDARLAIPRFPCDTRPAMKGRRVDQSYFTKKTVEDLTASPDVEDGKAPFR